VTLTSDECGVAAALERVLTKIPTSPRTGEKWGTLKT
jgi:hypothetical protein